MSMARTEVADFSNTPQTSPKLFSLSPTARRLYEVLVAAGNVVASHRGYCPGVTQVNYFCPAEVVADATCMARSTMYLKLKELEAAELVAARGHYTTLEGETKQDGTVWAVKLRPEVPGKISVPHDFLKAQYRCLSADIESGRTAYRQTRGQKKTIGQSKELQAKQVDTEKILLWALPPSRVEEPDTGMTVRCDLEQILDVAVVEKEDRNTAVDGAARAMASALRDPSGVMFYRWLLWQLLRLEAAGKDAPWFMIYEGIRRAQTDSREGFAKRPGALFVSRLKAGPWWDEIRRSPRLRVGQKPHLKRVAC